MQEQIWKDEAKEQLEKFYKEREQKLAANKVTKNKKKYDLTSLKGEKS